MSKRETRKIYYMKKLGLVLSLFILVSYNHTADPMVVEIPQSNELVVDVVNTSKVNAGDIDDLINAMIWVESRGDDSAYCKREEAVGCLQIRPIMLRECNRILELKNSTKRYTLLDRWARDKSIEIFHVVNQYYNKTNSYEAIARSWNGGPTWAQKSNTKKYWRKVQRKLKKSSNENEYSSNWLTQI